MSAQVYSDNRASLALELITQHCRALEGIHLQWLLVERDQRLLVEIVRIGDHLLQLLACVRRGSPAGLHPRGEDLTLVVHEVVLIFLLLGHSCVECSFGTLEAFLALQRLQIFASMWEEVSSFACNSEATLM